jgi:hypothetical protein
MVFARRVFLIAGIYGLLVLLPLSFMEGRIGRDQPPPITHPNTSMASSAWAPPGKWHS